MSREGQGASVLCMRPHLEYASAAWDPYLQKDKTQLEAVQRRAARFVRNEYSREPGTVTSLYRELDWDILEKRRKNPTPHHVSQNATRQCPHCATSISVSQGGITVVRSEAGVTCK